MARKKSQPLFEKFERVEKVRQGESLRFRDARGRLTKFDGRKKLTAEIWRVSTGKNSKGKKVTIARRTNKVLNKTKSGKPILQKFTAKKTKKQLLFLQNARQGPRHSSEVKNKRVTFDARHTIEDNVEAKLPEMVNDIVKYSRRGNGGYVTIEFTVMDPETNEEKFEVINLVLKGTRGYIIYTIAAAIIARLYANLKRMSSIKDSPIGKRGTYVRSISPRFTWMETKRLQNL